MQLLCQALQVTQPPCWDCLHCWAACKQGIPAALKHLYKLSAVLTHDSCVLQVEWRGEILQLSWSPRAYHLKGFLSDEECEHIKKIVSNSSNSSQHHILLAMLLLHVGCWLVLLSCTRTNRFCNCPTAAGTSCMLPTAAGANHLHNGMVCFLFSACSPGTS